MKTKWLCWIGNPNEGNGFCRSVVTAKSEVRARKFFANWWRVKLENVYVTWFGGELCGMYLDDVL